MSRVLVVIAVLLIGAGAALLALPYETAPGGPDGLLTSDLEVSCVAPAVDVAGGGEREGWLNVDPGEGASERAGGEWCSPESRLRLGGGVVAAWVGVGLLITAWRRRRPADGEEADGGGLVP